MKNPNYQTTKERGNRGEEIAVAFLKKNGFTILDLNWFYNKAEIDIIAQKGNFIIFVEVKTRNKNNYHKENTGDLLSVSQQKRIVRAAHQYIVQSDLDFEARFDLIIILTDEGTTELNHIEDAFYATL